MGTLGPHLLLEKVRSAGMRMVGPNCLGLLHTDAAPEERRVRRLPAAAPIAVVFIKSRRSIAAVFDSLTHDGLLV